MKKLIYILLFCLIPAFAFGATHTLTNAQGEVVTPSDFTPNLTAGDTLIISTSRTLAIYFQNIVGSSSNYITITNPSDSKVTISAATTSPAGYNIRIYNSRYFKILGNNYASETYGIRLTSRAIGIGPHTCQDYEIAWVEIDTKTGIGIAQNVHNDDGSAETSLTNVKIHDNYIHDIGNGSGFEECIYLGKSEVGTYPKFSNIQIYNNVIDTCGSDCLQLGQTTGSNNLIYGNTISNCGENQDGGQDYGIIINPEAAGIKIYNNIIKEVWDDGINIHNQASGNPYIHDNVIWNAGNDGSSPGIVVAVSSSTADIDNNTIVSSGGYGIQTNSGTGGSIEYNLLVQNGSGGINSSYSTQNDNRTAGSITTEDFNDCVSDASCNGDFQLTSTSPARDAGVGSGYSSTDLLGVSRPKGSAADIGAYEYSSAPTVTVTATDAEAAESPPNTGQFTIACSPNCAGETIVFTMSGTAAGTDYNLSESSPVAITGATKVITLTPVNDSWEENTETAIMTINSDTDYTVGSPSQATISILDDDLEPPSIQGVRFN